MRLTLTIPVPDNLDEALVRDLDQVAREAVAIRLYREGKLYHKQLGDLLGLDRWRTDELLMRHGIYNGPTAEEIDEEVRVFRELRRRAQG